MSSFTPLPPELVELMTPVELAEYEAILRAELAALDSEEGPAVTGAVDPDDPPATPGALAAALTEGREVQRPHLALLDQVLVDAAERGGQRVIVNIAPRYGKSRRIARWGVPWVLSQLPDTPVMLISHTAELVEAHSRFARDLLEQHDLGVRPRRDSRAVNRWQLDGYDGGILAAGIGGAVTGWGAGLLIIDDVIKNAKQAASREWRDKIWEFYTETLFDRLEPGASVVVVETRWHPQDLTGRLLSEFPGVWRHIRIPTIAEESDPLGRKPGELLWPERFDQAAVDEQRATLGSAAFAARHQQRPVAGAGGIWKPEWIDAHRTLVGHLPPLASTVVAVDPSGGGTSECGIVVVALGMDGDAYVLADESLRASSAEWGATAVRAAAHWQAQRIVVEDNFGGEQTEFVIRTAMRDLARGEVRLLHGGRPPKVDRINAKGAGKEVRARPVAALYEAGRVHHVDRGTGVNHLAQLEEQMTGWDGQGPSPDRLDAVTHAIRALLLPDQTKSQHVVVGQRWAHSRPR